MSDPTIHHVHHNHEHKVAFPELEVLWTLDFTADVSGQTLPCAIAFRFSQPATYLKWSPGLCVWSGAANDANIGCRLYHGQTSDRMVLQGMQYGTSYSKSGLFLVAKMHLNVPDLIPWQRLSNGLLEFYSTAAPGGATGSQTCFIEGTIQGVNG